MASGEARVGDVGTIFRATIKDDGVVVDVSTATTKQLIFRKADGTVVAKDATFTTDGTDGKIEYATEAAVVGPPAVAAFLSVAGQWAYQGYIVSAAGSWKSDIEQFVVHANLS